MQNRHNAMVLCGLTVILFIAFTGSASSTIFKYKKDGVWHFTDNPGEVPASPLTQSAEAPQESGPSGTDLKEQLAAVLKPKNEIETATLATVAIETTFGYGTGFFVTADGYIVTNKHVIRQTSGPGTADDPAAILKAEALERYDARIETETQRLEQARADIDAFRRYIDSQPESPTRQYNETRYQEGLQRFQRWEETMKEHRRKLASERSAFQATLLQRRVDASLAGLNRHFTVRLADNRPLHAYVVEISKTHDLALLKVDGYTTPNLTPENPFASAQGEPVYAIGNPVRLRNSVTAGVVSGFDGVFVKTNAQIYPGNSGGPLVTAKGQVIGINTFKSLTRKYEGLGFAISIQVALDAFDAI
jgi:V8-like Glu-specific endopeptidase